MKHKAIYPGSFDPITNGHIDIIQRGLAIFDEITIVIATNLRKNSAKSAWFTPDERKAMIKSIFRKEKRVNVDFCSGLMMDYAREHQVQCVLRGLRVASDFETEMMMATMNKELNPKVETVFMPTRKDLSFISSSILKEVASLGGDISEYVPAIVAKQIEKKVRGM